MAEGHIFIDVVNQFTYNLGAIKERKSQQYYGPVDFLTFSLSLYCPVTALATVRFRLQRIAPNSINKTHQSEENRTYSTALACVIARNAIAKGNIEQLLYRVMGVPSGHTPGRTEENDRI